MKLYYAPGACSLASHIALHEAGLTFEHIKVDLRAKTTGQGDDFRAINVKGYVPALQLDDGEVLTENIAVLDWIADQSPALRPDSALGRTRQLELLAFISTEIHKSYKPYFAGGSDEDKAKAATLIKQRFAVLADQLTGHYLSGDRPSAPDFYLFVMLLWAGKQGIDVPDRLRAFRDRMMGRDAVTTAMQHEGLL